MCLCGLENTFSGAISGDVFFFFLPKLYVLLGHHSSMQFGVKLKVSLMTKDTRNKDK